MKNNMLIHIVVLFIIDCLIFYSITKKQSKNKKYNEKETKQNKIQTSKQKTPRTRKSTAIGHFKGYIS